MDRNFYRFLDHFSTSTFFSAGENKFSYNLFKIEVNKKAKTLKDKDVKEGDFVGLKVKNPFEFFVTLFALWKIKAIAVPFSDKMPKENILKWSQDLPLALIIHNQEKYENVETNSIFFDKKNTLVSGVVILTSGSSGPPKGVLLTEENLFYSALGTNQFYNILPEDQWGLTLPHHHIAGLMIPLRCLLAGASVTLKEPQQPLPLFIQETKPTYLSVVPHQVKDMLDFKVKKEENKKSFSSLKAILVGGAFLSLQLKKRAKKESLPLSPTFGLTEMASQVTAQRPQDFLKDSPSDHFGHLLPFRKMAFDKDHKILLGGKTSFSGYLTKQKLIQPPYSDKFPNLWQGQDQGQYDQNLRLILKGRHDKVFISGGENINPFEIESVLLEHKDIDSSIVIPIPHFKFGKVPFAFYQSNINLSSDNLSYFCRQRLHPFKIPFDFYPLKKVSFSSLKPTYRELSLAAKNHIIKKNLYFKTEGDPKKPPAIFLHGFMGTHQDWDYFTLEFKKNYFCIFVDLPGHGKTPPSLSSFEELSFNLKELIQTLTEKKCFLIGYSLGGRVALDLASRYPEIISGMVLESCHPGLKSENEKIKRKKLDEELFSHVSDENKEDFLKFLQKWYSLPLFGNITKHKNFPKLIKRRIENNTIRLRTIMSSFGLGNQNNFLPIIHKGTPPTLYISGGQDKKYTDIGITLNKVSSSLDHAIIQKAAHNTHFEEPLQFQKLVLNFLDNLNS